jgi:hypothetical protein
MIQSDPESLGVMAQADNQALANFENLDLRAGTLAGDHFQQ